MTYRRSFTSRMNQSRRQRLRYARDPEYRLARVNHERARVGLPPLSSADEIGLAYSEVAKSKPRGPDGRFL